LVGIVVEQCREAKQKIAKRKQGVGVGMIRHEVRGCGHIARELRNRSGFD
jgi:hypothetical protein